MNDIYSPPEADITVEHEADRPTFLKSLGGFILSLLAVNILIIGLGVIYSLVVPAGIGSAPAIAFGILRFMIHLAWIIGWPMYCRRHGWPNLYRGARWHRLLFIALVSAAAVILVGMAMFA